MKRQAKLITAALLVFTALLLLSPSTAKALPPAQWNPGDEYQYFGHYFSEEYWTNDSIYVETENNYTVQFIMSYVNYTAEVGSFQAALLALGLIENETGVLSTLPYQLFGMHFTTPENKEIFVGAIFAFLYAYNDTNENRIPDSGEDFWYVIPYGTSAGNESRIPTVQAVTATRVAPGHYRFGVTYGNLYAKIITGGNNLLAFLLSLAFPICVAKFSNFTVTYDIQVNTTSGEVTAETFYTIGQVEELYLLGQKVDDPHEALKLVGVGAAHYVVVFTSNYYVQKGSTTPVPAADWIMANITTDAQGRERAFAIGTRGTYDLINESATPWETLNSSLPAYSWILEPKLSDLILVAWQLPFSAYIYSVFAYAISSYLQTLYDDPLDLFQHADTAFKSTQLWYGIAFPWYAGYRVEHDPVYTAYTNIGQETQPPAPIPGFPWEAIVLAMSGAMVLVLVVRRRKRSKSIN